MAEHTKNTTPDRQDQGTTARHSEYALDPGLRAHHKNHELDPGLRVRIAAFIDQFFEGESEDEGLGLEAVEGADFGAGECVEFDESEGSTFVFLSYDSALSEEESVFDKLVSSKPMAGKPAREKVKLESPALGAAPQGLRAWLDQVDDPFTTTLLALIDHKGMQDTEVYKRAHISRQLFSRIRSDANYRPAKETVLALAVGLQLNPEEARDLLERAGFALSRSSKRDVIVEYFLEKGIYNIMDINAALHEFDQALL